MEIVREDLFERLLQRTLAWAVGKVRGDAGGGRAGGVQLPDEAELRAELGKRKRRTDPDAGAEPFRRTEADAGAEPELTRDEENAFLADIENDPELTVLVAGAIAERGLEVRDTSGSRGLPDAPPVKSRMDTDVLAEIAEGDVEGSRGLVTTAALGEEGAAVLRAVLGRYREGTDSGVYCTVVDEILRAFYVADVGAAEWAAMKKETLDSFGDGDRGARLVMEALAKGLADKPATTVTLVGHSTGAVFIDNLLSDVVAKTGDGSRPWPDGRRFQVALLAPAATTLHFVTATGQAKDLVGRTRMFTMRPEAETQDRVAGAAYPRSLLYLVSGVLERDGDRSALSPLVGLARFLDKDLDGYATSKPGKAAQVAAWREFFSDADRLVLSPSAADAPEGHRAGALSHGSFDDDPLVRESLQHMIRTWEG